MVEHGTDEGWELGILLATLGLGVDGRLCVRVLATGVGQLGFVAAAEIL